MRRMTLSQYLIDLIGEITCEGLALGIERFLNFVEGDDSEERNEATERLRERLDRAGSRLLPEGLRDVRTAPRPPSPQIDHDTNGQLPAPGDTDAQTRRGPGRPRKNL